MSEALTHFKKSLLDIDGSHCPLKLNIGLVVVQSDHLGSLVSKYHVCLLYKFSLKSSVYVSI